MTSLSPRPSAAPVKRAALAAGALVLLLPLAACGGDAGAGNGSTVTVTVGYQSKTINTVTAGTLLRSLGSFEKRLNALHDGRTYKVVWQDYTVVDYPGVFVGMATIGVLGRLTSTAVELLGRRLTRWLPRTSYVPGPRPRPGKPARTAAGAPTTAPAADAAAGARHTTPGPGPASEEARDEQHLVRD
ncbi:hypothetical protein GCM10023220_04810 [Streptomyces ziwulingensis]|uniref:Uncharacterized protein n=1 Tax=Streptomyces ziwulingensis TaxID=1045501 RepID=A0ABP9ARM8_9ACTN